LTDPAFESTGVQAPESLDPRIIFSTPYPENIEYTDPCCQQDLENNKITEYGDFPMVVLQETDIIMMLDKP